MVAKGEAVAFLKSHEEDMMVDDYRDGGSVELSSLKKPPPPPPNGRLQLKQAPQAAPRCGGCGQLLSYEETETMCPGCDAPMHPTCGAPLGDDADSPFRLCATCESGHLYNNNNEQQLRSSGTVAVISPVAAGLRRRSLSDDYCCTSSDDDDEEQNDLSTLIRKSPPKSVSPRRRPSKLIQQQRKQSEQQPEKISMFGDLSNLVIFFMVLIIILIFYLAYNSFLFRSADDAPLHHHPNSTIDIMEVMDEYQSAWWMDDTGDDYLTKTYASSDHIHVRPVDVFAHTLFDDQCGYYRFEQRHLLKVSIIIGPIYASIDYPSGLLSMTVHSIWARTPHSLIDDILILKYDGVDMNQELKQLEKLSNKIKTADISSSSFESAAAQQDAIENAKGDVIVVITNPFVEIWSSTWLEHLLLPLMQYPRTISVPLLYAMTDKKKLKGTGDPSSYYMNLNRTFGLIKASSTTTKIEPSKWVPYESPFFEGPIFAMRRDQFLQLGGMDRGIYALNGAAAAIDLAFKAWMCRGRVVQIPCSKAGYVPQTEYALSPILDKLKETVGIDGNADYMFHGVKSDLETIFSVRNYLRIVHTCFQNHAAKKLFYVDSFGTTTLPSEWAALVGELKEQDAYWERNECHDFEWFDKHVLLSILGTHHPWHVKKGHDNIPK